MLSTCYVALVLLFLTTFIGDLTAEEPIAGKNTRCWCKQENGCRNAPETTANNDVEVILVSNGNSSTGVWKWDSFSTVITMFSTTQEIPNNNNIACEAHHRGKKYGFIMSLPTAVNDTFPETDQRQFIDAVTKRSKLWYADIIVLDMIETLQKSGEDFLNNLDKFLTKIETSGNGGRKVQQTIYCLVPWMLACQNDSCKSLRNLLTHCAALMLSPDSYLDTADQQRCVAIPTIPFTEFIYGIEQYLNLNNVPLVVGIPWHGYDYTCELSTADGRCQLKKNKDGTCDITKQRKRMSLAEIHEKSYFNLKNVKTDQLTQAAYLNYQDKATSVYHQVWLENADTLTIKYKIVNLLPVRGLSLWMAEDLADGFTTEKLQEDTNMWSWLMHEIIHKAAVNPPQITHYFADTVAGAAIGCLLLGTALGITFTCIALRRCKRSPPKRPFKLDETVDDFHDDPGL